MAPDPLLGITFGLVEFRPDLSDCLWKKRVACPFLPTANKNYFEIYFTQSVN